MITILQKHIQFGSGPKYRQICTGIQAALAAGELHPGDRLPPQRELADALGVTLGTVTRAYGEIDKLGLARGEIGRGTYIARREEEEFTLHALHNRTDSNSTSIIRFDLNFPVPEGSPDLNNMLEQLSKQPMMDEMLRYQPTAGLHRHRLAAARWLGRLNMAAQAENIAITTGAQHALLVALGSQLSPGDALAVDCHTYPGIINLAGFLHLRLIPVQGDEKGMRPDALEKAATRHRVKAVYMMPTMHNPTTITMPPERRRKLAEVLSNCDLMLVEDDVYGCMEQQPNSPIAAIIPERSFYLTNLSKPLAPGLRLGFLAVPEGQMTAVERVMAASIWMNPPLTTEIGCRWIDDGTADKVVNDKRLVAEQRMAVLTEKLVGHKLYFRQGGLHCWLQLPSPWNSENFARHAATMGVQVIPSANFSTGGPQMTEAVRICIGPPKNLAETSRGADILSRILAKPGGGSQPFM